MAELNKKIFYRYGTSDIAYIRDGIGSDKLHKTKALFYVWHHLASIKTALEQNYMIRW